MDKLVPHCESETSAPGKEETWPHFSPYSSSRSPSLMIVDRRVHQLTLFLSGTSSDTTTRGAVEIACLQIGG